MPRALYRLVWLTLLVMSTDASAKRYGVNTPSSRAIYTPTETFGEVLDQDQRNFVIEVALGAGPEGNLGLILGWLAKGIKGVEFYVGMGRDFSSAEIYTGATRYLMNFSGYRPFVSLGYQFQHLEAVDLETHAVFAETGYSWKLRYTYHLTVAVGARYVFDKQVLPGSVLEGPDIDQAFLDEQLDDVFPIVPTLALRFSRAF